jgi:hypothetical protein
MSNLSYEEYNDRAFVVYGDREKFTKTLRELGGRWNSRLKNGAGWTLPREKEEDLKKIIESLENDKDKQIDLIKQNVKSRKEQNKYCRAVSNSSSDEKQSPPKTEAAPQVEAVEKVKQSASASSSEEEEKEPEVKISVEENLLKERKEKERKKFEQEKREHEAKQKSQVQQSNSERTNSQRTNSQNTKENRKELEQPREVSRQPPRESKETVRDAPRERRHSRDARESRERRHSRDRKEGRKSRHSREQSRDVREQPREVRHVREHSRERRHSRDRKDPRESRTEVRDTGRETGRDNINYYKSFAKKKDTFKALYEKSESDTFTSSSEEDSSSDDFPTPESPKRRNHKNRSVEEDKLYNKVKDLQKQLYEMQIKQKKQKYEKK